MSKLTELKTSFTQLMGCRYPLIAGPMFLVSDPALVTAASEAGAIGGTPSLNWRTPELFRDAVRKIRSGTRQPFAVNLIVNQSNRRQHEDLAICVEEKVPMVITSLGNPKEVIRRMHEVGGKVFCDVTSLDYARKVEDLGADGVIAVSAGAGGHAGPISPLVLVPYLRKHLKIQVVLAGGIANGQQILAAMALGASAVQIGTRFIASTESNVDDSYKQAILKAAPEDIVMTKKISGTPAAVIKTPYIEKVGLELNPLEKLLYKYPNSRKYVKMLRYYVGARALQKGIVGPTWNQVWSAGQGVGLIDDILPVGKIIERLIEEYRDAVKGIPELSNS